MSEQKEQQSPVRAKNAQTDKWVCIACGAVNSPLERLLCFNCAAVNPANAPVRNDNSGEQWQQRASGAFMRDTGNRLQMLTADHLNRLEADSTAKDARITELEHLVELHSREAATHYVRAEQAEARLAEAEAALQLLHDRMDDFNADDGSRGRCRYCTEEGYDADGLKHDATCPLVIARKLLALHGLTYTAS